MSYYLGVDLGTTYTAAALARDGRAETVPLGTRSVAIPSVVYFDGEELVVGQPAVRRATTEPSRVASEFKRRLGDPVPLLLDGTPVAADHLMARLLGWVVDQVTATEGEPPAGLAVTHPANWGTYKLDLFSEAIQQLGLDVQHFVPEPVAAASFYAANRDLRPGTVVAVYDLGGGTFDAAVVGSEPSGFRILGRPDGMDRLGGVDFDQAVLRHVVDAAGVDLDRVDAADEALMAGLAQLRLNCIEAKEALSAETNVSIPVMLPKLHTTVRLTRVELESMIEPALRDTLVALRRAIASAEVAMEAVSAVLLVGGSSRIPLVAQLVMAELGRPIAVDARPKDAIPLGAAIVAWRAAAPTVPPELPAAPGAVPPAARQIEVPHDLSQVPLPQPVALPPAQASWAPPGVGVPGVASPLHPAGPQGPLQPASPAGTPRRRSRKPMAALVAVGVLVVVAGTAVAVRSVLPSGEDEIPQAAIERFSDACRQDFDVSGELQVVDPAICDCTLDVALAELTTRQFMANDQLLRETGHQVTQEFIDIMNGCHREASSATSTVGG